MDCRTSVVRPARPSMPDTCSDLLTEGRCSSVELQRLVTRGKEECQERCREDQVQLLHSYSRNS